MVILSNRGASSPSITRRTFLGGLAASGAVVACSGDDSAGSIPSTSSIPPVEFDTHPFTLGVASGDPTCSGVILWNRLAVDPLASGGAMPTQDVEIEVLLEGADLAETRLSATARREDGHSVHVPVEDLPPGTAFRYWFRVGDHESTEGVTRSLPAAGDESRSCARGC